MVDPADRAGRQKVAYLPDHRILHVVLSQDRRSPRRARIAGNPQASARLGAIGFSPDTSSPASSAATSISAWNWLGVVTDTRSTDRPLTSAR